MDVLNLLDAAWFGPVAKGEKPFSSFQEMTDREDGPGNSDKQQLSRAPGRAAANAPEAKAQSISGTALSSSVRPTTAQQQERHRSLAMSAHKAGHPPVLDIRASGGWQPGSAPVTPRQPLAKAKREATQQSLDELPGFGSWAQRQFRFQQPSPSSTAQDSPGTPKLGASSRGKLPRRSLSDAEDEDAARQAAWRWRFNRRWANEQARQLDPAQAALDDDPDTWDEALGFLDACGPVSRGHIARTVSTEHNLGQSLHSHGSGLSSGFLEESQREGLLKEHADLDATRALAAVARRAQDLFKQQQQIEKEVEQRWGTARGSVWVGAYMATAVVEKYGRCPFVLLRIAEREPGPQRMLVRSALDSTQPRLLAAASSEAQHVRTAHNLPPVRVELLGGGMLHWSGEHYDTVSIHAGSSVGDVGQYTPGEAARLTASVLRSALPMHQRINVAALGGSRA